MDDGDSLTRSQELSPFLPVEDADLLADLQVTLASLSAGMIWLRPDRLDSLLFEKH